MCVFVYAVEKRRSIDNGEWCVRGNDFAFALGHHLNMLGVHKTDRHY